MYHKHAYNLEKFVPIMPQSQASVKQHSPLAEKMTGKQEMSTNFTTTVTL
jgi:hypothetical protein